MQRRYRKTCTLCPEWIDNDMYLCRACYKNYKEYMTEPWFKELRTMQNALDYSHYREIPISEVEVQDISIKRKQSIRIKGKKIEQLILDIHDENKDKIKSGATNRKDKIGLRKIANIIFEKTGVTVHFLTVRKILKKYNRM